MEFFPFIGLHAQGKSKFKSMSAQAIRNDPGLYNVCGDW